MTSRSSITSLPFEIISHILYLASEANISEGLVPSYTYGLSQISNRPLNKHKLQIQKHVQGRIPTDILRWKASDAIRKTCSRWHEWASSYGLKELYVRRWRGGESWDPNFLAIPSPSGGPLTADIYPVVYRDPYRTLKSTATLLSDFPHLSTDVRRLWFSGIYTAETMAHVFAIIKNSTNLRFLTLPWAALRYGTVEDWIHITSLPRLTSLEFMSVDMKNLEKQSHVDNKALEDIRVDFSRIRRLKITGTSNLMGLGDADMWEMARTMKNLEELHITGRSIISIEGITALLSSSNKTLRILNYTPLDPATCGTSHFNPSPGEPKVHFCSIIKSCINLRDVSITAPHICEQLFRPPFDDEDHMNLHRMIDDEAELPNWEGKVTIRVPHGGRTCSYSNNNMEDGCNRDEISRILDAARDVCTRSRQRNQQLRDLADDLDIDIAIGNYQFNAMSFSVAGSFRMAKKMAEGMWNPEDERESTKGPYGSTGIWGSGGVSEMGRWSEIGEDAFWEGVAAGLVRFE